MIDLEVLRVSLGRAKADLVIKEGCLVNVYTGEVLEKMDVAIKGSRVAYVGADASHTIGPDTKVIDVDGSYVAPGFIDAHTHIDLYCTPAETAKAALLHGTTSLVTEPDELANVLGFEGVKFFVDLVRKLPLKVYVFIPLVCPQDPLFDDNPPLTLEEVEEALRWPEVLGLGEVVSWLRLIEEDPDYHAKVLAAQRAGKVVEGHTAGAKGIKLQGYVATGIYSCHEAIAADEALERLRLGVHVMIREGSLRRDLAGVLPGLIKSKVDLHNVSLVTDHVDPEDLVKLGYMDYVIREAIELGLDPVEAIRMATLNPARRFNLDHVIGGVGPGREADIVVLRDLDRVEVEATISRGKLVSLKGRLLIETTPAAYPDRFLRTVKVRRLRPDDFKITAPLREGRVRVRVMELLSETITRERVEELEVLDWEVKVPEGYLKVAVVDRHQLSGRISLGVMKGFGATVGGLASTLNFDENNLVVLGANEHDMAVAANRSAELGGGIVLVNEGRILEELDLPLAGVMSLKPLEEVASKLSSLNSTLRSLGSRLSKPLNVMLFVTFVTLPELRLSVKGLVDVKRRRLVPLMEGV